MWLLLIIVCPVLPDTHYNQATHNLALAGYFTSPIIKKKLIFKL